MKFNIDDELKKLNLEYKLSGEVNKEHLSAILKYCDCVEYFTNREGIYYYIRNDIIENFFIKRSQKHISPNNIFQFNSTDKITFRISLTTDYDCYLELSSSHKQNKVSTYYEFPLSSFDIKGHRKTVIRKCIDKFIDEYKIDRNIFNDDLDVKYAVFGGSYTDLSYKRFKELFFNND